jgi:hypothetical protein
MADEVFALSPISAHAALPSEADYDAIREAFMETSRGRWFLGEYAKRNRNADTTMVLDAVARIEETMAAQKKPLRDPSFDEALASLRTALGQAREAATAALADLALVENLAPVRKGARVIREIAWRLREIGADGRICDLIDSQVSAIEGSAGKLATADLAGALSGAFDGIEARIAIFDAGDAMAFPPPPTEASPSNNLDEAPLDEAPASAVSAATTEADVEASETKEAAEAVVSPVEAAATIEPVAEEAVAAAAVEAPSEPVDTFDANDEALLDMIALEMGAPDTDAAYEPPMDEISASETSYELDVSFEPRNPEAKSEAETSGPEEPIIATALPAVTPLQPVPEPVFKSGPEPEAKSELRSEAKPEPKPELKPAAEPSLGSSLLASGIVPRPRTSKPDPLAPIRRMSQTEKIAFFS